MSSATTYRTGLGASDAGSITLLDHSLADDLLGKVSFGELAFWLMAKQRPTAQQRNMFEAVLVALADHGFTPTAISARVTLTLGPPRRGTRRSDRERHLHGRGPQRRLPAARVIAGSA